MNGGGPMIDYVTLLLANMSAALVVLAAAAIWVFACFSAYWLHMKPAQ
jgi:hypothetical protein